MSDSLANQASMEGNPRGGRVRFIVGFSIIVLAVTFLVARGAKNSMVYYITPTELVTKAARGQASEGLRVKGEVVAGSIDHEELTLRFSMTDGGTVVPVVYRGVVPDTFNEDSEVVVEGGMQAGHFEADFLMAKCPSKYEAEMGDGESASVTS